MCFIQYTVQKNLILTIENEEKKKKKLDSISVKNLQFIFIIFFLWQNNKFTQFHTR